MSGLVTTYFEFSSPEEAQNALGLVPKIQNDYSSFYRVTGCGPNHNPCCIEVYFWQYPGEIALIAQTLNARRVTQDYIQIWPRLL